MIRLFTIVVLFQMSVNAFGQTPVELLTEQMKGIKTIKANFQQKIFDNKQRLMQESTGRLSLKRPNQLYWLTQSPFEHLVVTDGHDLWLYDIDLEQVNKDVFSEDLNQAPALLLGGQVDLIVKKYQVEQLDSQANGFLFKLTPLDDSGVFTALTIHFIDRKIHAMQMYDSFDQNTKIVFSDVTLNAAVDDKLFKFVVPDDVDLVVNER